MTPPLKSPERPGLPGLLKNWLDMPPVWLAGFLMLLWGQVRLWNPWAFEGRVSNGFGWGLIVLALCLMGWASLQFLHGRTSIIPRTDPKALLATGPYRFSRNPIYLADALVLLGAALVMGSALGLILVSLFMWVITRRFIHGEEARLRRTHAESVDEFFAQTRRWL